METIKSPAEHRVILHNTSWETYERLLDERGDCRVPRLAYDRGELEIMSPSSEHESTAVKALSSAALSTAGGPVQASEIKPATTARPSATRPVYEYDLTGCTVPLIRLLMGH